MNSDTAASLIKRRALCYVADVQNEEKFPRNIVVEAERTADMKPQGADYEGNPKPVMPIVMRDGTHDRNLTVAHARALAQALIEAADASEGVQS